MTNNNKIFLAILFFLSILTFLLTTSDVIPYEYGDPVTYYQQVDDINLSERTTHWGYIFLGILFNSLSPFSTDFSMNLLSVFCGAIGIICLYTINLKYTKCKLSSFFSALVIATSSNYWLHSSYGNVYQIQTILIWSAFAIWIHGKSDYFSGFLFALSILTNPNAIFMTPLFLYNRISIKRIIKFSSVILVIYSIFLLVYWEDFLFSPRGVLEWFNTDKYNQPDIRYLIVNSFLYIIKSFQYNSIYIVLGIVLMLFNFNKINRNLFYITILCIIGVFSMSRSQFPKLLPLYVFCSILLAYFSKVIINYNYNTYLKNVTYILIIGSLIPSFLYSLNEVNSKKFLYNHQKEMSMQLSTMVKKNDFILDNWSSGIAYERYNFNEIYTGKMIFVHNSDEIIQNLIANKNRNNKIWIFNKQVNKYILQHSEIDLKEIRINNTQVWFF